MLPICLLAWILLACSLSRVDVKGDSMSPTIENGESLKVNSSAYASASPMRGDIVVVRHAGVLRILRVVGLPGETIAIEGGSVSVNGTRLAEPYLAPGTTTTSATPRYVLAADCYFLLLDNRAQAADSRGDLGCVPKAEIVGKLDR